MHTENYKNRLKAWKKPCIWQERVAKSNLFKLASKQWLNRELSIVTGKLNSSVYSLTTEEPEDEARYFPTQIMALCLILHTFNICKGWKTTGSARITPDFNTSPSSYSPISHSLQIWLQDQNITKISDRNLPEPKTCTQTQVCSAQSGKPWKYSGCHTMDSKKHQRWLPY